MPAEATGTRDEFQGNPEREATANLTEPRQELQEQGGVEVAASWAPPESQERLLAECLEAIDLYERGDQLRRQCAARLDAAQARIESVRTDAEGRAVGTQPFAAG